MKVSEYWDRLKVTGWLRSVPAARQAALRARVARALKSGEGWEGLASGGYDIECVENEGDYVKLLDAYAEASFGRFKPRDASDTIDPENGAAVIRFTLKGKKYRRTFDHDGDTVSEDFDAVLNAVLARAGFKERFFQLPPEGQLARLVFVSPAALKKAVKAGLVPEQALGDEAEEDLMDTGPWVAHRDASGRLRGRLTRAEWLAHPFRVWGEALFLCGWETRAPLEAMTAVQRPLWLLFDYDQKMARDAWTNSHHFFLCASSTDRVVETVEALRRAGAEGYARLLDEASRRFQAGAGEDAYGDLDTAYDAAEPKLQHFLEKYVDQHVEEFVFIEG